MVPTMKDSLVVGPFFCVLLSTALKAPFGWENPAALGKMNLMELYKDGLKHPAFSGGSTSAIIFFLKPILEEYLRKDQKALEHLKVIIKQVLSAFGGL